MHYVIEQEGEEHFLVTEVEVDPNLGTLTMLPTHNTSLNTPPEPQRLELTEFVQFVRTREVPRAPQNTPAPPRWVWADTTAIYPVLLAHGVRVERCHDLRKSRAILRNAAWTNTSAFSPAFNATFNASPATTSPATTSPDNPDAWNSPPPTPSDALFTTTPVARQDPVAEYRRQLAVLHTAEPQLRGRLNFLLAAESAGTLIAAEMTHAGIPWRRDIHNDLLTAALGPRPAAGTRPQRLESLAQQIRELLDAPHLNPDSPRELLKALQQAGFNVKSTNKWEIKDIEHPATPLLLEYKKLARMMSANGWAWMDEWIKDGRFRPVYVPGGVVTGRWGADGGGALQLPHFVRPAVVADDGWSLVIADAAQLEPRILAAMSGDHAMASAGRGHDMYQGIADAGVTEDRAHAKYGMLGAMYGGTTGVSAQVLPRFKTAFPQAMSMVERAAQAGEQGGVVHTWLGRTSPPAAFGGGAEGEDAASAKDRRSRARSYGRFTRNFIVQGSAAEWALCWMASVRQKLWQLTLREAGVEAGSAEAGSAEAGLTEADSTDHPAPAVIDGPHLVFFLHDEILVHTPAHLALEVASIVENCAREAGTLLFGQTDVEFPITTAINTTYTDPKV